MSTQNVDLVRGHRRAWENDRDIDGLLAGWAVEVFSEVDEAERSPASQFRSAV